MNKGKSNTGFGIQKDIENGEAVILLRITKPRQLKVKQLGELLMKFLTGGYKTLILDQGSTGRKKFSLLEFLGRLQATFTESLQRRGERRMRELSGIRSF